ncbi:MAG: hypothetical protein VCB59_11720, partial [Gammaproteobacteria bacterium]
SDAQRSALLSAFTPGYILTQIPAAPLCRAIGAKGVLSLNNLGLLASLLAIPTAARRLSFCPSTGIEISASVIAHV